MPRVGIFYAMKANPDEEICKKLIELGNGFDCASTFEMEQAIRLGCDPEKIIFANPVKVRK